MASNPKSCDKSKSYVDEALRNIARVAGVRTIGAFSWSLDLQGSPQSLDAVCPGRIQSWNAMRPDRYRAVHIAQLRTLFREIAHND